MGDCNLFLAVNTWQLLLVEFLPIVLNGRLQCTLSKLFVLGKRCSSYFYSQRMGIVHIHRHRNFRNMHLIAHYKRQ